MKFISTLVLLALLVSPIYVSAQATSTASSTEAQINSLLEQVKKLIAIVTLLQQQLTERLSSGNYNPYSSPTNPYGQSGGSGGAFGGGSGSGGLFGGLGSQSGGGFGDLQSLILSALAAQNPTWLGSTDDSGVDYPVFGVQSSGEGRYDIGQPAAPLPGVSTAESQKLYTEAYQAASGAKPLTTSQYGRLGCSYAVSEILKRAGMSVGDPATLASTVNLKQAIDQNKGKFNLVGKGPAAVAAAIAGDVIISPTGGGKTGHVGICMGKGCEKIASNSSSQQRFIINYTNINWINRFHENIYVYRAGAISGTSAPAPEVAPAPPGFGEAATAPKVVKIFSTPDCPACVGAKKFMDNNGIKYEPMSAAEASQYSSYAPVIVYGSNNSVGFTDSVGSAILNWYRN